MSNNVVTDARSRIEALADAQSFVELGAKVSARATDFASQEKEAPGDGVITGYATVEGKLVYVYSQDASVLGGSMGEMHAAKIARLYDMAMKMGAPVIAMVDCAGVRLSEVTDALSGFGTLYLKQAQASGMIPEIMMVFGKCGGGMALSAGMSDFVFMEEKKSALFVNAPNTLDGNYKEKNNTASAKFQSENTGLVDGIGTAEEITDAVRKLIAVLPSNNEEAAVEDSTDSLNRLTENLSGVTDVHAIAETLADNFNFLETKKAFAPDMMTGFLLLDGVTVGVVGNVSENLTPNGCRKAAQFVNFCDAFEIPVLTLTNVKGYDASIASEKEMAKAASELVYAFANATVPKINVVLNAFGSAYNVMNSKAVGADIVYAMDDAEIGIMDAMSAAKILGGEDLKAVAEQFNEKQSAEMQAKRGYIDDVVEAADLRKSVLMALEMLFNKRGDDSRKKHGTK